MAEDTDNKNNEVLLKENRLLSVRLQIAQAFTSMWLRAYDALLSYQVNVRELKEYKDTTLLDKGLAKGRTLEEGRNDIIEYIKRVESGIVAAIRRKMIRKV